MSQSATARINIDVGSKGVDQAIAGLNRLAGANEDVVASLDKSTKTRERNEKAIDRLAQSLDREYKLSREIARAQKELDQARNAGLAGTMAYEKALAALTKRQESFGLSINDNIEKLNRMASAASAVNDRLNIRDSFSTDTRASDIAAYGVELDRVRAKFSPLFAEQQKYKASLIEVRDALRSGAITQAEYASALQRTKDAFAKSVAPLVARPVVGQDNIIKGLTLSANKYIDVAGNMSQHNDKLSKSFGSASHSSGLARHELVNLSRQIQDIGVSLASGQSPFTVLIQQGTQVADIFASRQGGIGSGLRGLAASIGGMITPTRALGVGVAAAAAVSIAALTRWKSAQDELAQSMAGLGRASGLTLGGANAIAGRAAGNGLSIRASQSLVAGFVGGGIDRGALGGLSALTPEFARKLGLSFDDAAKELTQAFADPAKGAEELSRKYALVTFAQEKHVRQLAAVGDKSAASAELLGDLRASLARIADRQSPFSKLIDRIEAGASDELTHAGRAIADTPAGPLQSFNKAFADFFNIKGSSQITRESASEQAFVEAEASRLKADQLARRNEELANLRDDTALAVREARARTFAEREAVASQRAYTQTLRDTNDAQKAAIAAERERATMLAAAARRVDEFERRGADTRATYGLSPYERGRQAILNEGRDLMLDLPNGATPMARAFDTAATAATNLANALNGAASKTGYPTPLAPPAGASPRLGGRGLYRSIIAAEGTDRYGDPYNTSLGYLRGPRRLTSMTMAESLAWGDNIRRNSDIGRRFNSSAKGAFQIVNSTQRLAMRALGIGQDELFSPENQQRMAAWIAKTQGLGAWEGFKAHPALKRGIGAVDIARGKNDNGTDLRGRAQAEINRNLDAYDREARAAPLRETDRALEEQTRLIEMQGRAFGASAEEIARESEVLRLRNEYARQGTPIDAELAKQIEERGRKAGKSAEQLDQLSRAQRRMIENQDLLRSSLNDGLGSFITDLRQGKRASDALASSLEGVASKMQNMIINRLTDSLFGEGGKAGGGFLSGLFAKLFQFEDGGVMTSRGPLPLRRYADGGVANSPQLALFGEGRGPEAYVPLKNGGIPVNLKMASSAQTGGAAPVTVNLIGAPPGAKVTETQDSRGGRRIDVVLNERIAASLGSPQGTEAMSGSYNLRPKVARR